MNNYNLVTYNHLRNKHQTNMHGDLDVIKVLEKSNFNNEYCELFNISMYKDIEEFCNFDYEWDDYGFRKSPLNEPSIDNNKNEVWCMGCSFTAGTGASSSYTWPTVLQEYTNKTVVNYGVGGAGPETTLRILSNWIEACKHKPANVLIYGHFPGRFEFKNELGHIFPFVSGEYDEIIEKYPHLKNEIVDKLISNEELYSRCDAEIRELLDNHNIDYTWLDVEENRLWRFEDPSWGRDLISMSDDLTIIDIIQKKIANGNRRLESVMRCHPGPKHHRKIAEQFNEYI